MALTATSASQVQVILWVAGITGMHHHTRLIFCIFSRDGFLHVGQADLELLTSGDPPASASQSAGITDMSHHTGLEILCRFCLYHKQVDDYVLITKL